MLKIEVETGRLWCGERGTVFADGGYEYSLSGEAAGRPVPAAALGRRQVASGAGHSVMQGIFEELQVELTHCFDTTPEGLQETISLRNLGSGPVRFADIGLGFSAELQGRSAWRLCAIPFRVQLDGSRHDYSGACLADGRFQNSVYRDSSRPEPMLCEAGRLRSEAWVWWAGGHGLLIAKYNNADIELSVASVFTRGGRKFLRFGGAGTCLYGEPARGHSLAPGQVFTFGTTYYRHIEGRLEDAFACYREILDGHGHGVPADYNPPVNWNELYDIGWHHSDPAALKAHYTRGALVEEAEKARACGCDLLYLDPGWEVAEGTTLWDESRLGSVESLVALLQKEYGLQLGFRTILRCYREHWERRHMVRHAVPRAPVKWGDQDLWELCLCSPSFRQEKLDRICSIARHGVRFLMVDEMDWRGPCHDPAHGHAVPTTAADHARAVYELCRELKRRCPGLVIECHDPVWPWHSCIYAPTYFQQGFGQNGAYDENWGFEYMWNCLDDLKSGKALALYYYNLACSVPLYLHITMAADNDNCLFFWWAASTVRHLGIGGKHGSPTVNPKDMTPYCPEKRFAAYRESMALYKRLKPYFSRGVFHGLGEHAHLHTLPGRAGGVLLMFNITGEERTMEARIDADVIRAGSNPRVLGAVSEAANGILHLRADIPGMSAAVISIGDAARWASGSRLNGAKLAHGGRGRPPSSAEIRAFSMEGGWPQPPFDGNMSLT